jgi:hypothetical protein
LLCFTRELLEVNLLGNSNHSLSTAFGSSKSPKEVSHFGSYLAGLWEGDGHIYISKPDTKVKTLSLSITFNIKDLPLAERLKDTIGHGWIRIKEKENACVLTFHTIAGLIQIVNLMNSNLRTPKLNKINELIDKINQKKGLSIKKYPVQSRDLSQDSWLAGFLDADGSFGIIDIKKEMDEQGKTLKKRRVACRLRIDQRMFDPFTNDSYKPILQKIATFFGVNLIVVKRETTQYFNITAKSRESITVVKNYLNSHPLFSSKYLDYKDWEIVVNLILSQTHYKEENSDLISELKNGINNSRKTFNWAHLDKLGKWKILVGCKSTNYSSILGVPGKSNTTEKVVSYNENLENVNLNSYLAGLFEGDGHIWMPKSNMTKKHNPRFCITFDLKNEPLAKKLLEVLESGHIRYKLKDNACVLIVSPVKGLKKIIQLINGELRTPKIHQLHTLIDWINANHSSNIDKLPLKKGLISNDSWLAGFVDADGGFYIGHTAAACGGCMTSGAAHTKLENNAKKRKISCRLRIEQRMVDPISKQSYSDVLIEIANFFNCKLLVRKQASTGNEYYTLAQSSRKSLQIILDYFERFPLYSSKYLDYKNWAEAARLILANEHYTEDGIVKIDSLKSSMNTKRTYFNWDHLNNIKLN